jgi:hypothetical protein
MLCVLLREFESVILVALAGYLVSDLQNPLDSSEMNQN